MAPGTANPLVSIVIPNHNGVAYLEGCLRSILRQTYRHSEVIIVDNASHDDSLALIRSEAPDAIVLPQTENLGFAAGANRGISAARGEWVAVLNNDTEVAKDWLEECIAALIRHPEADYLACRILDFHERNRIYSAGDCFLRGGIGYRRGQKLEDQDAYHRECEIFSACGCAALYRKTALENIGGYDESFFAYLEDVELGLRLHAIGSRGYYAWKAEVYHHGGATSGGEFSPLAVRLRTRNAILLLTKSVPGRILWRCMPMILVMQLSWIARALSRGRILSYLRGLGSVLPLLPDMIRKRREMKLHGNETTERLWQAILQSEAMAREDYSPYRQGETSTLLRWYFRVF